MHRLLYWYSNPVMSPITSPAPSKWFCFPTHAEIVSKNMVSDLYAMFKKNASGYKLAEPESNSYSESWWSLMLAFSNSHVWILLYQMVDTRTMSKLMWAVCRCYSYLPDLLYFQQQNRYLLDIVGHCSVNRWVSSPCRFDSKAMISQVLTTVHMDTCNGGTL